MSAQDNQANLETWWRVMNKVLAKLYLGLMPSSDPRDMRTLTQETLDWIDELFGIERPSAREIHHAIQETLEFDADLGSGMRNRILEEVIVFSQRKFGEWGKGVVNEMTPLIEELFNAILADEGVELSDEERQRLLEQIIAEILGLGPLEPLLAGDNISEIMVNGPHRIFVERDGKLTETHLSFRDDEHLMEKIYRIVAPLGRRLNESSPMVDARLLDGSRVNIVIPPVSLVGPVLTIRKFLRKRWNSIEGLVSLGTWNEDMVAFLRACVCGRLNIAIAGGTGAGKTTSLHLLASMIPDGERIITIENANEMQLPQQYVVTLESRPPNAEGQGEVTIRDLVINSLRMRPDRIVVGEVRGSEVVDLLQAMSTGHNGTMFTVHAGGARDALTRLEMMASSADPSVPLLNLRHKVASAVDLITYQERLRDGSRKILKVAEVTGMQGDAIGLQDVFEFRETGVDEQGKIVGDFAATGHVPGFLDRIKAAGVDLPMALFESQ